MKTKLSKKMEHSVNCSVVTNPINEMVNERASVSKSEFYSFLQELNLRTELGQIYSE